MSAERPSLNGERVRQLRGLVIHARRQHPRGEWPTNGRGLISTFPPATRRDGTCRWCERPTGRGNTVWHPGCVKAYTIATGTQRLAGGRAIVPRRPCACGGPAEELDHIVALAIAHARGDRRGVMRAYTEGNLRWMCRPCHKEKTREDRRIIANIKAGRPEEWQESDRRVLPGQMALWNEEDSEENE